MEPNSVNPQGEKPATPKGKRGRPRKNVLEFEFAQEAVVKSPEPLVSTSDLQSAPPPPPTAVAVSKTTPPTPAPEVWSTEGFSASKRTTPPEKPSTPTLSPSQTVPSVSLAPLKNTQPPGSTSRNTMANPPSKPSTITDFKRNVDQQKKEQKSFNNVLSVITYVVLIGLILISGLTGYGAHEFWLRLKDQASSISSLDQKLDASVLGINEDLHRTKEEIEKTTEEIAHQQEEISILRTTLDKTINDARADRAARARETAAIQKRLADLENKVNR